MTPFDQTVEDDCFTKRRVLAHALFNAFEADPEGPPLNFNRVVMVRMAYLLGQEWMSEWPAHLNPTVGAELVDLVRP
jgi:hypothetical protein